MADYYIKRPIPIKAEKMSEGFYVDTLEGRKYGKPGDYLLTGIDGERYPCDQEVFEASYVRFEGNPCVHNKEATCYYPRKLTPEICADCKAVSV